MLARAALSRVSSAATTVAPRAVALRPRFLAAAGAQSFLVFDESTGPLSDLTDKADAKVITYFTAAWCGPCRAIAPVFAELAAKNTGIKFVKIDVDDNSTTAGDANISGVPTFIGFAGGKSVDRFSGASRPQLDALVAKLRCGNLPMAVVTSCVTLAEVSGVP